MPIGVSVLKFSQKKEKNVLICVHIFLDRSGGTIGIAFAPQAEGWLFVSQPQQIYKSKQIVTVPLSNVKYNVFWEMIIINHGC